MRHFTKAQKGSATRDRFKWLHKQLLPKQAWALNSDLELVEKDPRPFIVARLDFKVMGSDGISFTEAISYKQFISMPMPYTIPVYIVWASSNFMRSDSELSDGRFDANALMAEAPNHRFNVEQLLDCDYRPDPPDTTPHRVLTEATWRELGDWEMALRRERRAEMAAWYSVQRHLLVPQRQLATVEGRHVRHD